MKQVPLSEIKDDLSRYLREAESQEIIITRHGEPAGILIGFESEDDWFEYRLEHDPRFLRRVDQARESFVRVAGRGWRTSTSISSRAQNPAASPQVTGLSKHALG
jgi:prevent-host-death family protein